MTSSLRPRSIPQCTACIRSYTFDGLANNSATASALRQQIRGKKKLANNSATVPVRLRRNVKTFGRKGAIVPIPRGQMRNEWFPRGVAEYVTLPELKTLRLKNVAMERDFGYGLTNLVKETSTTSEAMASWQKDIPSNIKKLSDDELRSASAFQKKAEVEKLTPERSTELLDLFVRPRLDFYRQPIVEEKEKEPEAPPPEPRRQSRLGASSGAAADLLAARMPQPEKPRAEPKGPQAIYGSVSIQDVLVALRAAMADNDEAARVVLQEQDITFVDLPEAEGGEAGKLKHVGDFSVEIRARGSDTPVRRVVRVSPQEL